MPRSTAQNSPDIHRESTQHTHLHPPVSAKMSELTQRLIAALLLLFRLFVLLSPPNGLVSAVSLSQCLNLRLASSTSADGGRFRERGKGARQVEGERKTGWEKEREKDTPWQGKQIHKEKRGQKRMRKRESGRERGILYYISGTLWPSALSFLWNANLILGPEMRVEGKNKAPVGKRTGIQELRLIELFTH